MTTLVYGDQSLQQFPDNVSSLILPVHLRNLVASQRSNGLNIVQTDSPFTVSVGNGVPTLVNPLLPSAVGSGDMWRMDGNNRATPDYVAQMPTVTIPPGYKKFIDVTFVLAAQKLGQGDDLYLFQLEVDGTPVGQGAQVTLGTVPTVVTLITSFLVAVDSGSALGLAVTGLGTSDALGLDSFEQLLVDFQPWTDPDA